MGGYDAPRHVPTIAFLAAATEEPGFARAFAFELCPKVVVAHEVFNCFSFTLRRISHDKNFHPTFNHTLVKGEE